MDFLHGKNKEVTEQVLEEESARRHHLVVCLSGSHAYGFPSPDSDLDLKAVHIDPTRKLLGLGSGRETFNRLEFIGDVEVDYTSNELHGVVQGIVQGNGNYIERVLGKLIPYQSDELASLKDLVPGVLSRRVFRHYRGFASSQRKAFATAEQPTVKKLLYVLRTALTGVHLLRTGELRVDLRTVADDYGFADAQELIEIKKQGERTVLAEVDCEVWAKRLDGLFQLLEEASVDSVLPEEPDTQAIENWLLETRKKHW